MALRRSQQPEFLHDIVEQFGPAGVERHRRVGVVALTADDGDWHGAGAHPVLVAGKYVLAGHGEFLAAFGEVDADVLARIFGR